MNFQSDGKLKRMSDKKRYLKYFVICYYNIRHIITITDFVVFFSFSSFSIWAKDNKAEGKLVVTEQTFTLL